MIECRIIKRTCVDDRVRYVIQQKHFLFRWWWVDAWINSWCGAYCTDDFDSLIDAKANLCYFNGSQSVDEVVHD